MSRILIAEDAALFRQIVRTVLSFDGHELFEAESGPQALRLAKEVVPDLVLMDVHMPGEFDGIETCRRMRGATALRHVPIVMLTAFDDPMMRSRAEDAGADAYLVKPFHPTEFIETVVRSLEKPMEVR